MGEGARKLIIRVVACSAHNRIMPSDWIAPVATAASGIAGIFFTWLTGSQSRKQTERLTARTEEAAKLNATIQHRKDAYLAAMRCVRLDLQRLKHKERRQEEQLQKIDETWSKGDRVRMAIEARVAVETFGTKETGRVAQELLDAMSVNDRSALLEAYERFVSAVRSDLGVPDAG